MRIDKFIAQNSEWSRSQIHALIKSGFVYCNQQSVNSPAFAVRPQDLIEVNNQVISIKKPVYIMMNKPSGVISATTDSSQPTVMDLIDRADKSSLQIVGRLDKDTTGLLLITDDGDWNHQLTSPKKSHSKTYQVTTSEPIAVSTVGIFAEGILLKSESKKTLPAKLVITSECHAELTLVEGKYHQVKRMFAAIGNHVTQLHRFKIGELALDGNLAPGEYRELTELEIKQVFSQTKIV